MPVWIGPTSTMLTAPALMKAVTPLARLLTRMDGATFLALQLKTWSTAYLRKQLVFSADSFGFACLLVTQWRRSNMTYFSGRLPGVWQGARSKHSRPVDIHKAVSFVSDGSLGKTASLRNGHRLESILP
jgi:hypothetical protein